jgi:glutaminase
MTRNIRSFSPGTSLLGLAAAVLMVSPVGAQSGANVQQTVDAAYAKFRTLSEGKNADYIPALARVDPNLFGIAVVSPPLVDAGNSVRAQRAITEISNALGGNPYAVGTR